MLKEILWSPLAENDLSNILDYLHENWTDEIALRFLNYIETISNQISKNPKQFPLANKKRKVRKCVITKHNTLFYRENREFIEFLRIFDTRQNPKKMRFN